MMAKRANILVDVLMIAVLSAVAVLAGVFDPRTPSSVQWAFVVMLVALAVVTAIREADLDSRMRSRLLWGIAALLGGLALMLWGIASRLAAP